MDPAIPLVLAQSLPAHRLLVSRWVDSLTSAPACPSSLEEEGDQSHLADRPPITQRASTQTPELVNKAAVHAEFKQKRTVT